MIARPPLAVPLVALAGFVILLSLVATSWPPLERLDVAISDTFRAYGERRPGVIAVLRVATDLAATIPFVSAGIAAFLLLRRSGDRRGAVLCAALTPAVPAIWFLLHTFLHRPRPQDGFVRIDSNGFPSGHSTMATAAVLVVVLLLWPRITRGLRVVAVVLAAGFAIFIGATRIALLAHWPADVFGGWLLALTVVPLAARMVGRVEVAPGRDPTAATSRHR